MLSDTESTPLPRTSSTQGREMRIETDAKILSLGCTCECCTRKSNLAMPHPNSIRVTTASPIANGQRRRTSQLLAIRTHNPFRRRHHRRILAFDLIQHAACYDQSLLGFGSNRLVSSLSDFHQPSQPCHEPSILVRRCFHDTRDHDKKRSFVPGLVDVLEPPFHSSFCVVNFLVCTISDRHIQQVYSFASIIPWVYRVYQHSIVPES